MTRQIVGVVGAGTMGGGIAEAALTHGLEVILYDVAEDILARARERTRASIARQVQRGRLAPEEAEGTLARLRLTTRLEDLRTAGVIIEAAPEDLTLKRDLFTRLDRIVSPTTILASNTSSLSITALAEGTRHPQRIVGMHFFNPAPIMPLVEVIPGAATAGEVVVAATTVVRALGKTPVEARDTPGFIVNRIARPFYLEALRLLGGGVASVEAIDRIMRSAGGFRMGPFELLDLIGLDVNLAVTRSIYEAFGREPRFRPHPIQIEMVEAGLLGRKSGRGFYIYEKGGAKGTPEPNTQMNGSIVPFAPPQHAPTNTAHPLPAEWPRLVLIVGGGRLAEELSRAVRETGREVETVPDLAGRAPGVDLIVDVLLDPAEKMQMFARTAGASAPAAVWLTLALVASPGRIAEAAPYPDRVVGFATLPPWADRKLVEIQTDPHAGPAAVTAAQTFFRLLGRDTAVVRNVPGGVFPGIFAMIVNEAAFALGEAVASAEDIDTALRLGANYPAGPLTAADRVGLDTLLAILEGLQREIDVDRYRPAPLLRSLVSRGSMGGGADVGFTKGV